MTSSIEIIEQKVFAHTVAEEIRFQIDEAVAARGRCAIMLAGGQTPAAIYRTLGHPPFVDAIPWSKVDLFWGDERWVSSDDGQSNFHMVQETLLGKLTNQQPQVHPINTSLKSPSTAASDYEACIRKITGVASPSVPSIDLIILGIGEDGHTASLFPGSPALKESKKLCAAADASATIKERVTITFPLIIEARKIIFIVSGESKSDVVKSIIEGGSDESVLPAAIYKKAKGKVTWFLDSHAGAKLSSPQQ